MSIKRALISVSDKTKIADFSRKLSELGIEIISTGGTAKLLKESSIPVREVSDYTGFPELFDGRVKTLHPKIHGAILASRQSESHLNQAKAQGIEFIDLVVVNLYPFQQTISKPSAKLDEAIENIDIGGVALIRAAAKNYKYVAVITSPDQHDAILSELQAKNGELSDETRFALAQAAFEHTANYDLAISSYLNSLDSGVLSEFPQNLSLNYQKVQELRYGENPHQSGAFYKAPFIKEPCVANAKQLHGKELSFNNILDLNAALEMVKDFDEPTAAIIKHNNPCGVASAKTSAQAYKDALACDSLSAFGSILGFNRPVDVETAEEVRKAAKEGAWAEAIIAPSYDEEALKLLKRVKDRRILEVGNFREQGTGNREQDKEYKKEYRFVVGGMLVQDRDLIDLKEDQLKVVTKRQPTEEEWESLRFAWKVCKHVKSNAILLAKGKQTVGIGAGQMSRVDSSIIAAIKAKERAKGSVLASDALIPFRDGVDAAAQAGVTAIIQPGGSIRDDEVISAADEHGMAMIFTGIRHFRH